MIVRACNSKNVIRACKNKKCNEGMQKQMV